MKKLFLIALIAALFLIVACGGGSDDPENSCPEGYEWSGSDCIKSSFGGDTGATDTEPQPDDDGDTADDSDEDTDTDTTDTGASDYNGSCKVIRSGDTLEINIETQKLTVGDFKINGEAAADADLYGELWAENKETLSEFKVGDVTPELSGKTFDFPKGRYSFFFRPAKSANQVVIEGMDNIDMASGDRKLDFDLPLYHWKGKVLNNSDAVFTAEEAYQAETKLIVKTGAFEKEIPYSEFSAFDLLLPKGSYTVYFKGQLAAGQGIFEGTVISDKAPVVLGNDTETDIKVKTITFAGSIEKTGYAVSSGSLVLVENPPLGAINGTVVSDLSAASYSITVTAGANLNLIYLPDANSYPVRYIKLDTWTPETESPSAHNITLDFARVYGKITFLGGNDFPTVAKCLADAECPEGGECGAVDCTIGKLKAAGEDQSVVIKDLGTALAADGEGNVSDVTYEALLVRRISWTGSDGNIQYNAKTYSMNFESHLNDVSGIFRSLPFSVPAEYENSEGKKVSSFSFGVTQGDGSTTYLTEKELNLDVAPAKVTGSITLDDAAPKVEKGDLIKLRDESGLEHSVINLAELSGGEYSFYAPDGAYDVVYEGSGILGSNFKTYIERDFNVKGDTGNGKLTMKKAKVTFDFNVNETPFAKWAGEQKSIESVGFAVNIDNTASDFLLGLEKSGDKYVSEVLLGSGALTVNAFLELAFADKIDSEKSYARIPVLIQQNLSSNYTVKNDLSLINFSLSVKLNGKDVTASEYAAKLKLSEKLYPAEIYVPGKASVGAFLLNREYKSPTPELSLNEGFDTKQDVPLSCIYFGK